MSTTIARVRDGMKQLNRRAMEAWFKVQVWRELTTQLNMRPTIFQVAPAMWQLATDSIFDSALLSLVDLLQADSLGMKWLLECVRETASKTEWNMPRKKLICFYKADKAKVEQWLDRMKTEIAYRNKKLAHFDKGHVDGSIGSQDLSVRPSEVRDVLFEMCKMLNRYSSFLDQTLLAWTTDGLSHSDAILRTLEIGLDERDRLLKVDSKNFQASLDTLDNDWNRQGRLHNAAEVVREEQEHGWKWRWMDRYQQEFRAGTWDK